MTTTDKLPPHPFPNRRAVEREIESAENPAGMQLNDGKERARLPGGTLRYMLRLIDSLAAPAAPSEPVKLSVKCVPVDSKLRDGNWNHPNDNEARTEACCAALRARGDDEGQGLDGYWKWGFAAGFNAALAAATQARRVAGPTDAERPEPLPVEVLKTWATLRCTPWPFSPNNVRQTHALCAWVQSAHRIVDKLATPPASGQVAR